MASSNQGQKFLSPHESIKNWIIQGHDQWLELFIPGYISSLEISDQYRFFFLSQLIAIEYNNEWMILKLQEWYDDYFKNDGTTWSVRLLDDNGIPDEMVKILFEVYNISIMEVAQALLKFVEPMVMTWMNRLIDLHHETISHEQWWQLVHERENMVDGPIIDDFLVYLENKVAATSEAVPEPGYIIDNPPDTYAEIIDDVGDALEKQEELRRRGVPTLITYPEIERIQKSISLFRTFGPVHISYNDTLKEWDDCSNYGGCRMFLCQCAENDEGIDDWFLGHCDVCLRIIPDRRWAIRRPLSQGSWEGCHCSEACAIRGILNATPDVGRNDVNGYDSYESWEKLKNETTILEQYMLQQVVQDLEKNGIYKA